VSSVKVGWWKDWKPWFWTPVKAPSRIKSGVLGETAAVSLRLFIDTEDLWKLNRGASADRYCVSKVDPTGDPSGTSLKVFDATANDDFLANCSRKFGSNDRGDSGETGGADLKILPDSGPFADAARLIDPYMSDRFEPSIPVFGPLG
jgi:hypothetical protein